MEYTSNYAELKMLLDMGILKKDASPSLYTKHMLWLRALGLLETQKMVSLRD